MGFFCVGSARTAGGGHTGNHPPSASLILRENAGLQVPLDLYSILVDLAFEGSAMAKTKAKRAALYVRVS